MKRLYKHKKEGALTLSRTETQSRNIFVSFAQFFYNTKENHQSRYVFRYSGDSLLYYF